MKKILIFLLISLQIGWPTFTWASNPPNTLTFYEVDGASQNNRIVVFGRSFARGEISTCPIPVVDSVQMDTSHYQVNGIGTVQPQRWDDGSVREARIFIKQDTFSSSSHHDVSFVNGSCNNSTTKFTRVQMTGFNSGNWNAQTLITAHSETVTSDAKVMLADTALVLNADRQIEWTALGPLTQEVRVQDATTARKYDFGWCWNGTTMNDNSGVPYTGNADCASLHPIFYLSFTSTNMVGVRYIIENTWQEHIQDQSYSAVLKAGATPTSVDTSSSFESNVSGVWLHIANTLWSRVYWNDSSGTTTAPGRVNFDMNFAYLSFSKGLPNYDQSRKADVTHAGASSDGVTSFDQWKIGDRGNIGGYGGLNAFDASYGSNSEGAPAQRELLLYYYNMSAATSTDGKTCGDANSQCAKAWTMLTGEVGSIHTSLTSYRVNTGGAFNMVLGVPYHGRRSASGSQYYCTNYDASILSSGNQTSGCGTGTGMSTGRPLSRHQDQGSQFLAYGAGTCLGTQGVVCTTKGWTIDNLHWMDYTYDAALLTGDPFYVDEEYYAAANVLWQVNPGCCADWTSDGVFGFISPGGASSRVTAWSTLTMQKAALLSPDTDSYGLSCGSIERCYLNSIIKSNAFIFEGWFNIITNPANPPSIRSCATVLGDTTHATRWELGRCIFGHGFTRSALHEIVFGGCNLSDVYATASLVSAVSSSTTPILTVRQGSPPLLGGALENVWGATNGGAGRNWTVLNGQWPTALIVHSSESLGLGTGAKTHFTGTLAFPAIYASPTFELFVNGVSKIVDASFGSGIFSNPDVSVILTYDTGAYDITFTVAPANGATVTATYVDGAHVTLSGVSTAGLTQPVSGSITISGWEMDINSSSFFNEPWMDSGFILALGLEKDLGTDAWDYVIPDADQHITTIVNDPDSNPYFTGLYESPARPGATNFSDDSSCSPSNTGAVLFTSVLAWKNAIIPPLQTVNTFANGGACGDHGYPLIARAAVIMAKQHNSIGGAAAALWMEGDGGVNPRHLPYFADAVTGSSTCSIYGDGQIKFAIMARDSIIPPTINSYSTGKSTGKFH